MEGLNDQNHLSKMLKSNRFSWHNLEDVPILNRASLNNLGLPPRWTTIYNENFQSFKSRWSLVYLTNLKRWIAPRYKPIANEKNQLNNANNYSQVIINNNDNNNYRNNNNIINKTSCVLMQNMNQFTTPSSIQSDQNVEKQLIKSNTTQQNNFAFSTKVSLPEHRTFELSLRKYPNCIKQTAHITKSINKFTENQNIKSNNLVCILNVLQNTAQSENTIKLNSMNLQIKDNTNVTNCNTNNNNNKLLKKNNTISLFNKQTGVNNQSFIMYKNKTMNKFQSNLQRKEMHMATIRFIGSSNADLDPKKLSNEQKSLFVTSDINLFKPDMEKKHKPAQLTGSVVKYYRKKLKQDAKIDHLINNTTLNFIT